MDYKEKLKAIINSNKTPFADIDTFLKYFPELKESEDERIRKELINYFLPVDARDSKKQEWIAWLEKQGNLVKYYEDKLDKCACDNFNKGYKKALEKQGEQKPAEWSEKDEKNLNEALSYIKDETLKTFIKDRVHHQPKNEWSEEDELMKKHCHQMLALLRPNSSELTKDIIDNCHHWLKSLRLQSTWKPSKEQIMALRWVLNHIPYDSHKEEISGLLEQLKKLREEQL